MANKTITNMYRKGWSITSASKYLGVTYQHLRAVIKGERVSHSLIRRVEALPVTHPSKAAKTQIGKRLVVEK